MSGLLQIHEPGSTPLPHADVTAIGIDLGTTHSVVAVSTGRTAEAIHDPNGRAIIPSLVQIEGGHTTVGFEARKALLEGETGVLASIKRLMGRSAADLTDEALPYTLDTASEGMVRLKVGDRSITPVEVSAEILSYLKRMAEDALGREVRDAVITVPAYFDDAARAATKDAAAIAGLNVLRLINEPTAAALAYGLDTQAEGVFAIYDLGGGTFDISILKLQDGVFQVLATAGDTQLGGDDIDRAIAAHVTGGRKLPPTEYGQLLAQARQAKEGLSIGEETRFVWEGREVHLTRSQLEHFAEPLVARSLACCARALDDAKMTPQALKGVVLVGGSTRMQLVKDAVAKFFGIAPHDSIDPDLTVALGAAIQAEALTKGADHLLLDVIPLSLGLETMGGIVEKILERNSPIPASVAQEFTTYQDGQAAMKIHVVQGEREKASDNRSLANFELRGIPPLPAGIARIRVTFTVDADGLLTVAARELTTGAEQQVAVKPSYGLAFEEIERMLTESMQNARADIVERLLIEARVEGEQLVNEVRSAMAQSPLLLKPGEAAMFESQLTRLEAAVKGTDRERIDYERGQLNTLVGPFAGRRMDEAIGAALAGKNVDEVT